MVKPEARALDSRIVFADALRLFAILSVVLCHFIGVLPHTTAGLAEEFANLGGWGVGCFFVLTGFLLGRSYLQMIVDPANRSFPSTRLFFTRRFYRIFPLYAFAVIVTAIAGWSHRHAASVTLANVAVHLTFLQGFFPQYDGAPFGPLWTMAVDAQFYLVLPLVAFVVYWLLHDRPRGVRIAGVVTLLVATIIVSIAFRTIVALRQPIVFANFEASLVYVRNLIGMSSSFALGVGLALCGVLKIKASPRVAGTSIALGLGFAILFCLMHVKGNPFIAMVFGDLVAGLSATLILWGCIEGRFSMLTQIAGAPITAALAALSYAIYLFHKPIMVGVHDFLLAHGHGMSALDAVASVTIALFLMGLAALVGHHFIERPFLNARDRNRENSRAPVPTIQYEGRPDGELLAEATLTSP